MKTIFGITLCFVFCLASCNSVQAENWMRFRGGQGISTEKELPVKWSNTENIKWKMELPGKGWSSPIVFEEHIFITASTEEGVKASVLTAKMVALPGKQVHRQKPGPMRKQNHMPANGN